MKAKDEFLVIYAVRYCLGRSSYAPGEVVEWVLDHIDDIQDSTKRQITRDILNEVAREIRYNNIRYESRDAPSSLLGQSPDRWNWATCLTACAERKHGVEPKPGDIMLTTSRIPVVVVSATHQTEDGPRCECYRLEDGKYWAGTSSFKAMLGRTGVEPVEGSWWKANGE